MATGKIGGLRAPKVPFQVEAEATERAMVFASGWMKKERGDFEAAMAELREIAEHNATVYAQASAALNDLSRREKAVRDAEKRLDEQKAKAEADIASRREALAEAEKRAATDRAKVDQDRKLLAEEKQKASEQFAERGKSVSAREKEADKRETSLARREKACEARELSVTDRESRLNGTVARLRDILSGL